MLRIRLRRIGSRGDPCYRVVVSDSRSTPTGSFKEVIGYYDPGQHPAKVEIDLVRADEWVRKGARASDTVKSLLKQLKSAQA